MRNESMQKCIKFIKEEIVLTIALVLAVVSSFIIVPDAQYVEYIDFRTLAILFCLMAVMAGLQKIGVFGQIARSMLGKVRNIRQLVLILVLLCFGFSMLITNDVALITFVPFTFIVLKLLGEDRAANLAVPVVVIQTIAANLGSMLTPIGNPQNLYLYGISGMGVGEFVLLMLPYTLVSLALCAGWCMLQGKGSRSANIAVIPGAMALEQDRDNGAESSQAKYPLQYKKALLTYLVLFVLCLLTVARILPYGVTLVVVIAAVLLVDRQVLARVDYSLLLTFVGFFIFIGNMGRIPAFRTFLEGIIAGNEVLTAVVSSQIISNVPAALLLSGFTGDYAGLIVGTNLGGLGTLIASMASLISFKYIGKEIPEKKGAYLAYFTAANVIFLVVLLVVHFV